MSFLFKGAEVDQPSVIRSLRDATKVLTELKAIHVVKTVSINPGSIATVSRGTATATIQGLEVGDVVYPVALPALNDDLIYLTADVSAANTVRIHLYNPTAGAIDDGALNWDFIWFDLT